MGSIERFAGTPSPSGPIPPESGDPHIEHTTRVLGRIRESGSFDEYSDITRMYRSLPGEDLVVRREDPEKLMRTLSEHDPLEIKFEGNVPYANSVVWNPRADGTRGIDNAFLEGHGHSDGIVMVYGFSKPEDFRLTQHPESQQMFGGIERSRVRTAAGFVPADHIRFVTVRVPISRFPEALMTEEEKDILWEYENGARKEPAFVYRGFLAKEEAADLPMAA